MNGFHLRLVNFKSREFKLSQTSHLPSLRPQAWMDVGTYRTYIQAIRLWIHLSCGGHFHHIHYQSLLSYQILTPSIRLTTDFLLPTENRSAVNSPTALRGMTGRLGLRGAAGGPAPSMQVGQGPASPPFQKAEVFHSRRIIGHDLGGDEFLYWRGSSFNLSIGLAPSALVDL
jgi:hypothetical protein